MGELQAWSLPFPPSLSYSKWLEAEVDWATVTTASN